MNHIIERMDDVFPAGLACRRRTKHVRQWIESIADDLRRAGPGSCVRMPVEIVSKYKSTTSAITTGIRVCREQSTSSVVLRIRKVDGAVYVTCEPGEREQTGDGDD